MNRDVQYAEACLPARWRVAGVPLQPFCLGHALGLLRVRSRFMTDGEKREVGSFAELMQAVWICSHRWTSLDQLGAALSRPLPWSWRVYCGCLRVWWGTRPEQLLARVMLLKAYIGAELARAPRPWSGGERQSPPMGGAVLGRLRLRLRAIGMADADALTMPLGQVLAELSYHQEDMGRLRLVTEAEEAAMLERAE